jgi:hypothetical protein
MYDLHYAFTKALEIVCTPTVTTERVILYMLRSHVSFAEQPDGTIVPNARWPNAVWNHSEAFGGHHATKQSDGYSMHVGARAYTKTTRVYAQSDPVVDYELFYGIGPDGRPNDHFEREHPAGLLNSWMSYYLPDPCDEMPYTDEAALWFHRLMQSMAEMQRRIQRMVQDKPKFIEVVNSGLNLPFSGRSS